VLLRNLVTNSLVAKFEGHSLNINNAKFAKNEKEIGCYSFISCAGSESLFWQIE